MKKTKRSAIQLPNLDNCKHEGTCSRVDRSSNSGKSFMKQFLVSNKCATKPKIFYGIGACLVDYATLVECLMKQYYYMIPMGGVCRSANQMVRQLDRGFFGFGCPHPAIECLAA
jgi:hypothetical protein